MKIKYVDPKCPDALRVIDILGYWFCIFFVTKWLVGHFELSARVLNIKY